MHKLITGIGLLSLLLLALPVLGQSSETNSCPQIVTTALDITDEACSAIDRNEVCYGHALIEASVLADVDSGFTTAGDRVNLDDLRSIRLSPMDERDGVWGVSLMRLQASLPDDAPGRNVTLVVFGDVALENQAEEVTLADVTVSSFANLNVRLTPRLGAYVLATLSSGEQITANGRLADNSWLRVSVPQTGENGWINIRSVEPNPALNALAVVEETSTYYRPMQAFYFQSGNNDSPCPEAPNSGLLIQTPEGAGKLRFLVNEVSIRLGSTMLLQTTPSNEMILSLLEGSATVEAFGVTQVLFPGTQVRIPLGPNNIPVGPPSPPEPYDGTQALVAPTGQLDKAFPIVRPMTHGEIYAQMVDLYGAPPAPVIVVEDSAPDGSPPTVSGESQPPVQEGSSTTETGSAPANPLITTEEPPLDGGCVGDDCNGDDGGGSDDGGGDDGGSDDGGGDDGGSDDGGGGDDGGGKDSDEDHDSGKGNDDDWVPPGQRDK